MAASINSRKNFLNATALSPPSSLPTITICLGRRGQRSAERAPRMGEQVPHSRWQGLGDGGLWKDIPYLQRLGNLLRRSAVTSVMAKRM